MHYGRNHTLLGNARTLRKNMTKEERHLWFDFLRYCRPRFRRQEIIGNYILDFFCYEAKLVVEIDGSQHFTPENTREDNGRTAYFHSLGIRVMRVDNKQVNENFSGVCEGIILAMKQCGTEVTLKMEA